MRLMPIDEVGRLINGRLDSKDWWIFVASHDLGAAFLQHVEETYYSDDKNIDFELTMAFGFMSPLTGIVMAKKKHMSAHELADLMNLYLQASDGEEEATEDELEKRDILFLGIDPAQLDKFSLWLGEEDTQP